MYEKFNLEKNQLDLISSWFKNNKSLLIYGGIGTGKTTLSKEILKDRIITHIDSLFMKNNSDIYDYIKNIIQKRNITMMFQTQKQKRGIIIDDIDILFRYDKKTFRSIINLLGSELYGTKIIITSSKKFIKNRTLDKISFMKIHLSYDSIKFHKICKNICNENNINLSLIEKQKFINKSFDNISLLKSLLMNHKNNITLFDIDKNENEDKLYNNIFEKKYSLKELIRLYNYNKTKISLDLLENLFDITGNIELIRKIYNYYSISDIFETKCINYSLVKDYDIIFTIYNFHSIIKKFNLNNNNKFVPNKYISKSLIHVYSYKNNYHKDIIYFYLYLFDKKILKEETKQILLSMDKNFLNIFIKTYNHYYNSKIKYENIYK